MEELIGYNYLKIEVRYIEGKEIQLVDRERKSLKKRQLLIGGSITMAFWTGGTTMTTKTKQQVVSPVPLLLMQPLLPATMAMNCSNVKPKFSGKPEKDPEAQLLRMIDLIEIYHFRANQRVRRFSEGFSETLKAKQDNGTN